MGTAADLISVAAAEVGYLEKKSNAYLYEKTANAGRNNYTKYGEWYGMNGPSYPYCDIFVSWCAEKAGCSDVVGKFAYCPSHVGWFSNRKQLHYRSSEYDPQPGDIIFFDSDGSGTACHVGIVYASDDTYVYTIEGNTGGSGLVSEGQGVFKKQYRKTSSYVLCYGHPDYDEEQAAQAHGDDWQAFNIAAGVQLWTNNNISRPVYQTSDLCNKIGSMDPNEQAWCLGRVGDAYIVYYHVDGTDWTYKIGFVNYDGGTGF